MALKIPFIKGHMGGNEIVLLWDLNPKRDNIDIGLMAVRPPFNLCDELGLIYPTTDTNRVTVKITWKISDQYIFMCGGLTQVLGQALADIPDFAVSVGVKISEPFTHVILDTDAGPIPIIIKIVNRQIQYVKTDMTYYLDMCYLQGVHPVNVEGIPAMRVGEFLVINADDIVIKYPDIRMKDMDDSTWQILAEIQKDWFYQGFDGHGVAVYDLNPDKEGDVRITFPHDALLKCMETSCGTGSVAAGIAIFEKGELPAGNDTFSVSFETGGDPGLGGPDRLQLELGINNNRPNSAFMSHNHNEIIARGELFIGNDAIGRS